jgi:hypothetical protein
MFATLGRPGWACLPGRPLAGIVVHMIRSPGGSVVTAGWQPRRQRCPGPGRPGPRVAWPRRPGTL